ncbi:hypothetical protein SDRG_10485 [Saprolegnia diclina VS20]|uniref:Uncharacterized protein n=1 Tax=Saprolegnia diclina (strain VS20) TaxID=1156394 RepID=T0QBF0_SAPDV|nr:hypothetical protein SDRG_10485 [Saprolegnia diclina VS20]EQC31971.1 hypothetical protein SDRG_10485 [Saprolegnia diclina VS20]|eukprot:XP_008614699.1 hypothetical protein SDRG_10485 [Saprolegnia diclina VS20]
MGWQLSSTSSRNAVLAWTRPIKADAIVVLKRYVRRPVLVFCLLKHALSAIYFGLTVGSLLTITPTEAQTVQVYSVPASTVANIALLLAHLYSIGPLLCLLHSQRRLHLRPSSRFLWLETRTASCVFQALELGMQSFQAWRLSFYVTSMTVVCVYTSCIALNCLVSPLLLTSRAPFVHKTLRLFLNGVLGFTLYTAFPLLDLAPRIYAKKFQPIAIASQLRNDASWLTMTTLGMRGYISNTLMSLICKVLLGALNIWTMQLLAQSVLQMSPRARACAITAPPCPPAAIAPHNEKMASRLVSLSELQQYWNRNLTRPAKAICLALILWGLVLIANIIWLLGFKSVCPSTCKVAVTPLLRHVSCYCAYAHVHCPTTTTNDDDGGVAYLQSQLAPLGTRLFYLEIDHCPLPHGVPAHVLAPFAKLFALRVLFSNMTSFDGVDLPSSLMVLELRYNAFTIAPTVVTTALPPMLL